MIIDIHGHYTTAPQPLKDYRARQIEALKTPLADSFDEEVKISDDQIRESLEDSQIKRMRERKIDRTIFSPIAGQMGHHIGSQITSERWSRHCNNLIHRVVNLYPDNFIGVCQLPQSTGVSPKNCAAELERCINELGFVGCNLSPDPSGGHWKDPPLYDRFWYPIYEKMVELDVPAMIHVSGSCNPCFHHTGAHYINGDTTAFMQFIQGDLFKDFPTIRFVIPHGGGAAPYHWGRYRGLALDMKRPTVESMLKNVYFDTCVYHKPGIELLLKVVPADNILFATETFGAVRGVDPNTGHHFDDTQRYIDACNFVSAADREKIFQNNAFKVYPRLKQKIKL